MIGKNYLIYYTGHPFVDVGVAVLTRLASERSPRDVTVQQLETIAIRLKEIFLPKDIFQNELMNSITRAFFPNSQFIQSSATREKQEAYAEKVFFSFRVDTEPEDAELKGQMCTFFPDKPAVMRAYRQHIPWLNASEAGNFSASGIPGVPVSGIAVLAAHAMMLGAFYVDQFLIFHQIAHYKDNENEGGLNLILASKALAHNLSVISLASKGADKGAFRIGRHVRTRFIENILWARQQIRGRGELLHNIAGYHFNNDNQYYSYEIIRLDNRVLDFVEKAEQDAPTAWHRLIKHMWLRRSDDPVDITEDTIRERKNRLYEALYTLPASASQFINEFFRPTLNMRDVKQKYPYLIESGQWELIEIFLAKVMNMEQYHIENFKEIARRILDYMLEFEAPSLGFYYEFSRRSRYRFDQALRRAEDKLLKRGYEPLFTLESYIDAFESDLIKWYSARDLITIRLRELIYQHREQFNLDTLPDETEDDEIEDLSKTEEE